MTHALYVRNAFGAFVVLSILLGSCSGDDSPESAPTRPVTEADFIAELVLGEFSIGGDLVVAAGEITAAVVNTGIVEHNVGLEGGPFSPTLNSNEEAELDMGPLAPGEYVLYCDIDGHRASGMEATLVVLEVVDGSIPDVE